MSTLICINSPTSTDDTEYILISTIFVILGRGFAAIALSASIQMTCEMFLTVVRSQGVAIASAVGMATSFLSPFIIHSVSWINPWWAQTSWALMNFALAERYPSQCALLQSLLHLTLGLGECHFLARDRGRGFGQYHCGGRRFRKGSVIFPPTFCKEKTWEIGSNEWLEFEPTARWHMFDHRSQPRSSRELNYHHLKFFVFFDAGDFPIITLSQ